MGIHGCCVSQEVILLCVLWCECDAVKSFHTAGNLIFAGTERMGAACVSMHKSLQQGNIPVLTSHGNEETVYTAVGDMAKKF